MSITSEPKNFTVLYVDMNSFFASIEQQVRPELRGQPIGVAPYTGSSGCIIAASKEAKKSGIKICRISDAKRILPNIKIIEARPALYMIYHKEIKKVVESLTPFYEVFSIDEMAIYLTPLDQNEKNAIKLAKKLKEKICRDVGDSLTCSVGIGPSKFLAKMAAGSMKPDGLVILNLEQLEEFYGKIKLTDLTGINVRMEARLNHKGIYTPLDLYHASLGFLIQNFNHLGRMWYYRLRGYEVDNHDSKTKTIGHSHVLEPGLRDRQSALSVLRKLVFKAGYRIRREKYLAHGIYLTIGFVGGGSFSQSVRSAEAFSDNQSFWQKVSALAGKCSWSSKPIYLAVGAFGLKKNQGKQISIFDEIEKRERLATALDDINDDYGSETVMPASMIRAGDSAPDRIPFGRPRYDILH